MIANKLYRSVCFIVLWGLLGGTQISLAGQGLFLRINSYFPDGQVKLLSSECLSTDMSSLPVNTINYIEANDNIFCTSSITFVLQKNNVNIGSPIKITLSELGSTLPSPSVQEFNGITVATTSYPHFGLTGTQDRVMISFGPPVDGWMTQMSDVLASKKPSNITLPGSHDTGTYGITVAGSTITPDLDPVLADFLKPLGTEANNILKRWAVSQFLDAKDQLKLGVRYFDIRVCKTDTGALYTCHALTGAGISEILTQVATFLAEPGHEHEWVILDFNHIYGYQTGEPLSDLANLVSTTLGNALATPVEFSTANTFSDFWKKNKQVIAFLSDPNYVGQYPNLFWSGQDIHSPWPNVQDLNSLTQAMNQNLTQREFPAFFVLQSQETPSTDTIIKSLEPNQPNSLLGLTGTYKNGVQQWLNDNKSLVQQQGNIIIEDFTNGLDLTNLSKELNSAQ